MEDQLFTRQEAAIRLRIGIRSLDDMIASGSAPSQTRIGRRVFFTDKALSEWIKSRTERPGGEAA